MAGGGEKTALECGFTRAWANLDTIYANECMALIKSELGEVGVAATN